MCVSTQQPKIRGMKALFLLLMIFFFRLTTCLVYKYIYSYHDPQPGPIRFWSADLSRL